MPMDEKLTDEYREQILAAVSRIDLHPGAIYTRKGKTTEHTTEFCVEIDPKDRQKPISISYAALTQFRMDMRADNLTIEVEPGDCDDGHPYWEQSVLVWCPVVRTTESKTPVPAGYSIVPDAWLGYQCEAVWPAKGLTGDQYADALAQCCAHRDLVVANVDVGWTTIATSITDSWPVGWYEMEPGATGRVRLRPAGLLALTRHLPGSARKLLG